MTTMPADIIAIHSYDYSYNPGYDTIILQFDFADVGMRNLVSQPNWAGTLASPANHASGIFTSASDMAMYYFSTASSTLISEINTYQSITTYTAGNLVMTDEDTQIIINTKQNQHANLDKLSSVSLSPSSLFMTDATVTNVVQIPMSAFVAGIMNSVDAAALGGAMALPYSSLTGVPAIPTLTSQLTNNSSYVTSSAVAASYVAKSVTVNGHPLSSSISVTASDLSLATVATSGSYNDLINQPVIPSIARTTSVLALSLVGTGATGTQISSTKDSSVKFCVSTSATATIAGAAVSTVALKICSTNSSTEANWTTVGTSETSQSYSLAVALQGVTGGKGQLFSDVPSGWYVKLVNSGSGTHTEAFVSGQQTIYG